MNLEKTKIENIIKIRIIDIEDFENHPFKVTHDNSFNELLDSIEKNGLLNPIIVRKKKSGYEIISGHRRKEAMELLGYKYINAIVKDLNDDEAIIQMVDSNINREKILPSEKAFAYKMKLDAIKHQGKTCGTQFHKSRDIIGIESGRQINNYIRLSYFINDILKLVDNTFLYDKRNSLTMGIKPAVELSYLNKDEQKLVYETIKYTNCTPSHSQAIFIRQLSKSKKINFNVLEEILSQKKGNQNEKISFNKYRIEQVLPLNLIQRDKRYIEDYIIKAIDFYNKNN